MNNKKEGTNTEAIQDIGSEYYPSFMSKTYIIDGGTPVVNNLRSFLCLLNSDKNSEQSSSGGDDHRAFNMESWALPAIRDFGHDGWFQKRFIYRVRTIN